MSDDGDDGVDLQPRRAGLEEARAVADLWLLSRRASNPHVPPSAHSDDEVRAWFSDVVLPSQGVWVIGKAGQLVALMVLVHEWIEQLYVHPSWSDRGLGSRLLELAKGEHACLDLWTFQSNVRARRFYERNGFVAVAVTDGDNEEGVPDMRYHWERD